ncbi:YktB family protein [Bacillus benzoevorans]|uniref:UPF0637 protein HNR53_000279 n=1 Tax=Bacillus benzoevorans TaxID=1456 RepID=A0A7X0HQH7_9BACI|nr:DUF1054 domain-containing protein [Bacillus benzoevorans]MBB6443691.1 uncharacterized protein YktB (UPF0637 family) [Bacillus benzoevorans]
MNFNGFTESDFDVFLIDGLDARMEALKTHIRPKLETLGAYFAPILSSMTGDEMFAHVAKHARRTINPPKDTWVAFASNSRGYKMLPHFQIGLWRTHLFIWFALIYEAPHKSEFGRRLELNVENIYREIPKDFVWSVDHMKPEVQKHGQLSQEDLTNMFVRVQTVKKAEILCGYQISKQQAITIPGNQLLEQTQFVFETLLPLYKMIETS